MDGLTKYGGDILNTPMKVAFDKTVEIKDVLIKDNKCFDLCTGLCCPVCVIAYSLNKFEEGTFVMSCLSLTFATEFCFIPLWCYTIPLINKLNEQLGGRKLHCLESCFCLICCLPCFACQINRAVKNAYINGMLKSPTEQGAPLIAEMV